MEISLFSSPPQGGGGNVLKVCHLVVYFVIFLKRCYVQPAAVMLYCKEQGILIVKWDSTVSSSSISKYSCSPDVNVAPYKNYLPLKGSVANKKVHESREIAQLVCGVKKFGKHCCRIFGGIVQTITVQYCAYSRLLKMWAIKLVLSTSIKKI